MLDGFSTTQQSPAPSSQDSENQEEASHSRILHAHLTASNQRQPQPAGLHPGLKCPSSVGSHKGWAGYSPGRARSVGKLQGDGEKGQGFGTIRFQIPVLSFAKRTILSRMVVKFERRVVHIAWQRVSSQKRIRAFPPVALTTKKKNDTAII